MPSGARTFTLLVLTSSALACGALLGISPPPDADDAGVDARAPDAADGGTGDSGSGDSGVGDAGSDATFDSGTDAPLPTPYWSFGDDFESGDLTRWPAPGTGANGTVGVVDAGAFAGCCAFHASADAGANAGEYVYKTWTTATPSAAPVTSGTVAMRAHIKAITLDHDTRELSLLQGGQTPKWFANAGVGNDGPGFTWGFILLNPSYPVVGGYNRQSQKVIANAFGAWHCAEFIVNVSGPAGHLAIFMDDQPTPEIQGDADTTVDVGWDTVSLGLGYASGATSASELFMDDVRIALYHDQLPTIHIGCK